MDRYSQLVRRSLGRIRAQIEEEEREDDDFTTGFINFRTRHDSRPGQTAAASSYRKRKTPLYSFKICCLKEPTDRVSPRLIRRLNACNLGSRKIVIGRNESMVKLRQTVRDLYPALGLTDFSFKIANSASGNRLVAVDEHLGLRSLKHEVKFKSLYVVPEHVLDVEEENNATDHDHADELGNTDHMEI